MAETENSRDGQGPTPGTAQILDDWVTIWHSEMAGLVLDREMQDTALRCIDAWAAQARAALRAMAPALDAAHHAAWGPHGHTGPVPPPGSAPAADASDAEPDARDAAIRDLLARVAELERRLAASPSAPLPPQS